MESIFRTNRMAAIKERDLKTSVSKIAYLIGVKERYFDGSLFSKDEYDALEQNTIARTIRSLCNLRTELIRNYKYIDFEVLYGFKTLDKANPQLVPQDDIAYLKDVGINLVKANRRVKDYIIDLNTLVANNINACEEMFPEWVKWEYMRNLFVMPKGNTEAGVEAACNMYRMNYNSYPFNRYVNMPFRKEGNILHNDTKFFNLLYEFNGDQFDHQDKTVRSMTTGDEKNIDSFLDKHEKICVVVDCENSNPYLLCDALNSIKREKGEKADRILKVILFDDSHTVDSWGWMSDYIPFKTERVIVERINKHKSLVDQRITAKTQEEYYENGTTGFILVSSDSDYWGLIAYSKADFLVLAERSKTGDYFTDALHSANVNFGFLEDFTSIDTSFKEKTLSEMMNQYFVEHVELDLNEMFKQILMKSMIPVTEREAAAMKERMINSLHVKADGTGKLVIVCA